MKKSCAVLAMMLFAGKTLVLPASDLSPRELFLRNLVKKDGVESLKASPWFKSVSVTPTNLVLQRQSFGSHLWILSSDNVQEGRSTEYGEEFALTPDQGIKLSTLRHTDLIFTPASFKNQLKGFRVLHVMDDRLGGYITNCLGYVALSDKPTEVHEKDVEMIMENGEWKKYEQSQPVPKTENDVQDTPPSREAPVTVTNDETPITVTEDGQDEEKSKAATFWLYALIPLCLLAVFWVVRQTRLTR